MIRRFLGALLLLTLLVQPLTGLAQTDASPQARDLTAECLLNGYLDSTHMDQLRDGNYRTFWTSRMQEDAHALYISAPDPAWGLLVRWRTPAALAVQVREGDEWMTIAQTDTEYAAAFVTLPGVTEFRLVRRDQPRRKLEICEISVFGAGRIPTWVPRFREPQEQVDLMLLSAHPDDEVLWFGGLLPYYAGERDKECLVVCFAFNAYHRRLELLDCLWTCGVEAYPVFAGYQDYFTSTLKDMYRYWRKPYLYQDVCDLYRRYRPQVVVSHDKHGEYGHGAHQAVSDAARKAVALAADETQHTATAKTLGVWQVPKVYIHLWPEGEITMDWHQPLQAFDGKTAQEVAQEGYACHTSQQHKQWAVLDGGEFDNSRFGLFYSAVGPDMKGNDLFEHLD